MLEATDRLVGAGTMPVKLTQQSPDPRRIRKSLPGRHETGLDRVCVLDPQEERRDPAVVTVSLRCIPGEHGMNRGLRGRRIARGQGKPGQGEPHHGDVGSKRRETPYHPQRLPRVARSREPKPAAQAPGDDSPTPSRRGDTVHSLAFHSRRRLHGSTGTVYFPRLKGSSL